MENKIVVGILNIVEETLKEFGVILPDDHREDSDDPIVGYTYAELHDKIKEYLEEKGVLETQPDFTYEERSCSSDQKEKITYIEKERI